MKAAYDFTRAFTLTEMLVVLVLVALLLGLLIPALKKSKAHESRINCLSNLKQIGLAMRMTSNEHGGRFPWEVPRAEGGSLECLSSAEVFRHFLSTSNQLVTPKYLLCPQDVERQKARTWDRISNSNLSYFAGFDAATDKPQSILSGDRTLAFDGTNAVGLVVIRSNTDVRITRGFHAGGMNIALGDGSAQQVTVSAARNLLQHTNAWPIRLAVP
jgi:prepilin-type N-terminal cleavage/methylation domain-containing protein/prepilin-type processing-associated H-X9-DG protein